MKEIVIATGTYQKQDGTQGTNWTKIGIINTSANGKEYALLDPKVNLAGFEREAGKDMIMCSIVDKSNNQQQPNQGYQQQAQQQNYNAPQQQGQPQQNQGYQQPQYQQNN